MVKKKALKYIAIAAIMVALYLPVDSFAQSGALTDSISLKKIFANHKAVMLLIDPKEEKIIAASAAACAFYGYSLKELAGMPVSSINTLTREQVLAECKAAAEEKRNYFIFRHRKANGDIRTVEVYSSPVSINGRQLLLSIVHDISQDRIQQKDLWQYQSRLEEIIGGKERQQLLLIIITVALLIMAIALFVVLRKKSKVERHLRESEGTLMAIFNAANIGVCITDSRGYYAIFNSHWEEMLGYTDEELKQITYLDISDPEYKEISREKFQSVLSGQIKEYRLEKKYIRKDGSRFWGDLSMSPIWDNDGTVKYMVGMVKDITAQKESEIALVNSQRMLEMVLNAIPVRVFWKDKNLTYLGCNLPFALDAGLKDPAEIIGKNDYLMPWREQAELYRDDDSSVINSKIPKVGYEELQTTPENEQIWLRTTKVPLIDSNNEVYGILGVYENVTRYKQIEEELRRNEELLDSTGELASIGGWEIDLRTSTVNWTKGTYAIHEVGPEYQPTIENIWGYFNPDDKPLLESKVAKCIETGESMDIELRFKTSKGKNLITRIICTPISEGGKAVKLRGVFQDITARKSMEAEILQNKIRLEVLVKILKYETTSSADFLEFALKEIIRMTKSKTGCIIGSDVYNRLYFIHAWNPDEAPSCNGNTFRSVSEIENAGLWGESLFIPSPMLSNSVDEDVAWIDIRETEYEIKRFLTVPVNHDNKSTVIVSVANKETDYEEPEILQLMLLVESIWDNMLRLRAEEELRQNEERVNYALNATNDAIWDYMPLENHLFWSPRYYTMLGYRPEEFSPSIERWRTLLHPDDLIRAERALGNCLNRGVEEYNVESRYLTKSDGYKWILARGKVMEISDGGLVKRLTGTHTDISEMKKAEESVRQSERNLQQLNAEKDKLFSIIAHDLRSPFQGLIGTMQILSNDMHELSLGEIQTLMKSTEQSAKNIYKLVENLLEWSNIQRNTISFSPISVDMHEAVDANFASHLAMANLKQIDLVNEIPEGKLIFADLNMLNVILRNLISNSLKFTARGGRIIISSVELEDEQEFIVKDTGIGIPPNILPLLFSIGEKTSRKGTEGEPSSGLGLLLCKEYVDRHGGRIWAENGTDCGAEIHFTWGSESVVNGVKL